MSNVSIGQVRTQSLEQDESVKHLLCSYLGSTFVGGIIDLASAHIRLIDKFMYHSD